MSDRFDSGRRRGYNDESVSSMEGHHRDQMAWTAERWLGRFLGDDAQVLAQMKGKDPGWDIVFRGWKIDVKWTPYEPGGPFKTPTYPHLIVPAWKPRRADLYALVVGENEDRFDAWADWGCGFETRQVVEAAKVVDWGKARKTSGRSAPVYAIGFDYLRPLAELHSIASR